MGRLRYGRCTLAGIAVALGAALAFPGCSEKAGGTRYPNEPPDTHISKGPSETSPTYYMVDLYWYGTDRDGDIQYYEMAVVKGLRRGQPVDLDTLYWHRTAAKDTTFIVPADSCCYGEPGPEDPHYALSYWGVFVRAVDNDRGVDDSPASIFFLASNEIPKARITAPIEGPGDVDICQRPYFEWEGTDPDGDRTQLEYKYIALPVGMSEDEWGGGLPPYGHEGRGEGNASPEIGTWSEWVSADCTYVDDVDLSEYAAGSPGYDPVDFVVTVRDEGGAALPPELFDTYNAGANVRRLLVIPGECSVPGRIESDRLGVVTASDCTGRPSGPPVIFSGAGIYLRFFAVEDRLSSRMADDYRYYFDDPGGPMSSWTQWTAVEPLRNAGTEPEWEVLWPASGPRVEPEAGPHVFALELRDRGGDTTCVELHFDVLEGPAGLESNILLVDDDRGRWWTGGSVPDYEDRESQMWSSVLEGYDWQEWDTGYDFDQPVPAALVGEATTVIWSVDEGRWLAPDLLNLCADGGNYLHSYVEAGGNLIVIGRSPVYCTMYRYDRTPDPATRQDVNSVEFLPLELDDTHSFGHFMWDVFGIRSMRLEEGPAHLYVTGIEPCQGYAEWGAVPAKPEGAITGWPGYFDGAFIITSLRPGDDVHPFYGVRRVTNPADPDTAWVEEADCYKIAAVYVEGDDSRGWAAYISLPAWWLGQDGLTAMIRGLLEMFGE